MLKELLDALPAKDRGALDYAFEHGLMFYVLTDGGSRFIGVNFEDNISKIPFLKCEKTIGTWSIGRTSKKE